MKHEITGENNIVYFKFNDGSTVSHLDLSNDEKELFEKKFISINGNNNKVYFSVPEKKQLYNFLSKEGYKIYIVGDNNLIDIKNVKNTVNPKKGIFGAEFCIADINKENKSGALPVNNCKISIGNNTVITTLRIYLPKSDFTVDIGEKCLLGQNLTIMGTDYPENETPSSFNLYNTNNISISDDVWFADNISIYKNSKISSYSIVSKNSVVCSKFTKEHLLISGNPAKIELENIGKALSELNYYMEKAKSSNL